MIPHYNNWPDHIRNFFIENAEFLKEEKKLTLWESILKSFQYAFRSYGYVHYYPMAISYLDDFTDEKDNTIDKISLEFSIVDNPGILLFFKEEKKNSEDFRKHHDLVSVDKQRIKGIRVNKILEDYPKATIIFDLDSSDVKSLKETTWKSTL